MIFKRLPRRIQLGKLGRLKQHIFLQMEKCRLYSDLCQFRNCTYLRKFTYLPWFTVCILGMYERREVTKWKLYISVGKLPVEGVQARQGRIQILITCVHCRIIVICYCTLLSPWNGCYSREKCFNLFERKKH